MGPLRTYTRFIRVVWRFLPLLWTYARDRRRFILVGGRRRPSRETQRRRADVLVDAFLTLGPTFIKLGQLLSTRPDVLPPVYIERLSQLQDDVPPAPWSETRSVIEGSIGPVGDRFAEFDTDAISGASLGQVYRGRIDDRAVAVKVRRPGVTELVETDLRILGFALPLLLPFIDDARAFSLENLADEFSKVIREEMDYERERAMIEEIGSNFAGEGWVRIPDSVESHSTDRVLTMEYVEGTKITDVEALETQDIDRSAVAERLERAYLQMVLEDGVFHADPHPGNLAVQPDGTIVFYDFGMSGRIEASTREQIIRFYVAVAERDIGAIMDALVELGTLSPDVDRRVMGEVLELAIRDARGEAIEEWRVQQIVRRLESTMYEFPIRMPAHLALVMRVATVVEGVCVTLDPDFDFIEVATAFLVERGYREESARRFIRERSADVGRAGLATVRAAPKFDRILDRLEREEAFVRIGLEDQIGVLEVLTRRLIYGVIVGAGLVSASFIYAGHGLDPIAGIPVLVALIAAGLLLRSFRRRRIRARPQFTRQSLRRRRE